MLKLSAVLARHVDDIPEFGHGRSPRAGSLGHELKAVSRQATVVFTLLVIMLVILFVGCVVLIATSLDRPERIAAILAASGVSMPLIVKTMMTLWKEKVASDILTAMVATLDPGVSRTVVQVVASQLYGRSGAAEGRRRAAARR